MEPYGTVIVVYSQSQIGKTLKQNQKEKLKKENKCVLYICVYMYTHIYITHILLHITQGYILIKSLFKNVTCAHKLFEHIIHVKYMYI